MTKNEFIERIVIGCTAAQAAFVLENPKKYIAEELSVFSLTHIFLADGIAKEMEERGHEFEDKQPPLYYMQGRGTPKV